MLAPSISIFFAFRFEVCLDFNVQGFGIEGSCVTIVRLAGSDPFRLA